MPVLSKRIILECFYLCNYVDPWTCIWRLAEYPAMDSNVTHTVDMYKSHDKNSNNKD